MPSCMPKVCGFDFWSGHIPRLQFDPGCGAYKRQLIDEEILRKVEIDPMVFNEAHFPGIYLVDSGLGM